MILIQDAKYYSMLVDETSDISVTEQVSVCFRLVDSNLLVHELFTGPSRPAGIQDLIKSGQKPLVRLKPWTWKNHSFLECVQLQDV